MLWFGWYGALCKDYIKNVEDQQSSRNFISQGWMTINVLKYPHPQDAWLNSMEVCYAVIGLLVLFYDNKKFMAELFWYAFTFKVLNCALSIWMIK